MVDGSLLLDPATHADADMGEEGLRRLQALRVQWPARFKLLKRHAGGEALGSIASKAGVQYTSLLATFKKIAEELGVKDSKEAVALFLRHEDDFDN